MLTAVPGGADVYVMKHVLHGYEDERAVTILKNGRAAMGSEGRLLVIEFVLPDVGDRVDGDLELRLMSDLNMLAVTGGRERTESDWIELLCTSGLRVMGVVPVEGDSASIIEIRPG